MFSVSPCRSRVRTLLLWAAPVAWLGCGGGGTDVVLPSLSVTTSTEGVELDPDGYNLVVDWSQTQPIGAAATVIVERLIEGQHTLELSGLAENCSIQGENPRSITVRSGATTSSAFAVLCAARSGSIQVSASGTGSGTDPDGFTLVIDGSEWGPVAVNAGASLEGMAPGAHNVGLTGVAGNCQVQGDNPRTVVLSAGQAAQVTFVVTCVAPGPGTGAIELTTSTSGSDPDPNGYSVSLDGGPSQPVGINGTLTLTNLSSGAHRLELLDVAANCAVGGANPRNTTVAAGQTGTVTFAITCGPPAPGAGTLQVTTGTTGPDQDPDGYAVSVDGGGGQSIGVNATLSVPSVSAAEHEVRLTGVADNCSVTGANPIRVVVPAGGSGRATFAITCTARPPATGSVRVNVATSGGSQDDGYTFRLDGGGAQAIGANEGRTIQGLSVGTHTVLLEDIATNCTLTGDNRRSVTVVAGETATVEFAVSCAATGPSVNLRVERMYLTQSTQRLAGNVPLVQGRDGLLRVFVTASAQNTVRPSVRVQLFQNGVSTSSFTITAPAGSTPRSLEEQTLGSSWNVNIPGSLIGPNLSVLAEVDPENAVAETNEADNRFPGSGTPQPLSVQAVPAAAIRLVPIRQAANNLVGEAGNPAQLLDLVRRMYPLNSVTVDVRQVFTAGGPLQPFDDNRQWNQILSDLEALRIADGAFDRTYYGLVRLDYNTGIVGNGFVGAPSAIGTDAPQDARRVIAHELGHTWGQFHTPCGSPPEEGLDPNYPYRTGNIGVFGYDATGRSLKPPSLPDIMGYCENPWISDYIYEAVMSYRRANPAGAGVAALAQPCLLVWGRIVDGQAVLEPAFQIVTRPRMPAKRGAYSLEASGSDGSRMFTMSFDPIPTADDPRGSRHFAFAVPLDQLGAARLGSLRLTGPGIRVASLSRSAVRLQRAVRPDEVVLRREGGAVKLEWDAAAHPMIMVRDPETGDVLSFARGGNAQVWTQKAELELQVSDGVQSQGMRRAISR